MDSNALIISDFEEFLDDFRKHQNAVLLFLQQSETEALQAGNESLTRYIRLEKERVLSGLDNLFKKTGDFYPLLERELSKRTNRLEKQIGTLNKTKDTLVSDNILLEYKKKDLLLLTTKLEEAYEEISAKNKELILQQQKIYDQAEKLNAIHQEMLEKNKELEQQKEALLDQSDYLHEANQAITQMHMQVQQQKDEILHKNEELQSLNTEKNNLIGIVAHDLKSPLNQINGLLNLIKLSQPNIDSDTLQYLEMMGTSIKRMTDMIAKILDVEAIESKKLNLNLEQINLSELVRALGERYVLPAKQKDIQIVFGIEPDIYAFADKVYAEQAFENLVSNAIKFSQPKKKVFVNLQLANGLAKGEVKDEGPGISDEDKKKLFSKYQKLSARPTGNETSTGLGLSIVKKFVEAMNGQIWCESEAGKGASFFITLPLK